MGSALGLTAMAMTVRTTGFYMNLFQPDES
jgi:hypothetical protein